MTGPVTPDVVESTPSDGGLLSSLATRLGCTEGQLYSMAIALAVSSALVLGGGVPLGDAPKLQAAPLPAAPPVAVAPVPSNPTAPPPLGPLVPGPGTLAPGPIAPGPGVSGPAGPPDPLGPPTQPAAQDLWVPAPGRPRALVVDEGHVYVGTDNDSSASRLVAFSRGGDPSRVFTIQGQPQDHVGGLSAAALHGSTVLVTERSRGVLMTLDPRTGAQRVVTALPDLPPCLIGITGTCQPGAQDLPATPEGLVVAGRYAYVSDAAQGTIWRYDLTANQLTAWYASSDLSPGGPSGLALDSNGDLVFTVAQSADPAALLRGAVYRLDVTADGSAGDRTLLASFATEDGVGPVAVGRSAVYVGLRGKGGVVAVSPDGTTTVVASAGKVPAPAGLSLVEGTLYVADAGKPATAFSGVVRALPVADGPV